MARPTGAVHLADLINEGLLEAGERLVLRRRSAPDVTATLRADGTIDLDGEVFATPSAAARHVLGRTVQGWTRWRVVRLDSWTLERVRDLQGTQPPPLSAQKTGLNLGALGGEPFGCLLADPPWRFQNRTGKVAPEHRRLSRYDTMSVDQICALPVPEVMADQSHCYLWVPNTLLADGLKVMEAWGFTYKSMLVWHKVRKDGGSDGRGVGFYFRNVTEPVLFGVRGRLRTLAPGRRQVNYLATRKREHSRKPDEFYDIVEDCSPGPYLEMFARYPREGWQVWGDESDAAVQPRGKRYAAYGADGDTTVPVAPA